MIRRLTAVAALVAAQGLVLVGTAHADASSVRVERGQLIFQAAPGQTNRVAISDDGRALVITDAVPMVPGPGCDRVSETQVSCQSAAISALAVDLGDGDDTAINATPIPGAITGSSGKDTLTGGSGGDTILGGAGEDILKGEGGPDYLHGGDDHDKLYGGPGEDELHGGHWNDSLDGGTENDIINGTDGMRDRVVYVDRVEPVTVTLAVTPDPGTTTIETSTGTETDTLYNIQDVEGGMKGDTINGDAQFNDLVGGPGEDTIYGNGGDDVISGGDHNDHLWGGDRDDTLYGSAGVDDLHGEGHLNGDGCDAGGQVGDTVATCNP